MQLDIVPLRQQTRTACSWTCVQMACSYQGISSEDIKQYLRGDSDRVRVFDLAAATKRATDAQVHVQFARYEKFAHAPEGLSEPTASKTLATDQFPYALETGVVLHHTNAVAQRIEACLQAGTPVIAFVSVGDLRRQRLDEWRGHYIVISGYENDTYTYIDPHWEDHRHGTRQMTKRRMLTAIARTKNCALMWMNK